MKKLHYFLIISILIFYYLCNEFIDSGGKAFPLLKIILKLIILFFILVMLCFRDDIKEITQLDKFKKKIDDYYKKNK